MTEQFSGTGVALITPFTPDLQIDHAALRALVSYVVEGGVDYLVILGTTAESATLSRSEKQEVMRTVISAADGNLPLVLGIGGNNTRAVIAEIEATDLQGFSGILSVSPYYNRPTQEGIFQHFKALAKTSPLPLILYNVPARTGSNVLPETVFRLAKECANIIGIKEASGDLDQIRNLIANSPDGFLVISGDDLTAVPAILEGGAGVISVLGQGIPSVYSEMIRRAMDGRVSEAMEFHKQLEPLVNMLFQEGNPAGIKGLLASRGISDTTVRLPLVAPSNGLVRSIESFLNERLPAL